QSICCSCPIVWEKELWIGDLHSQVFQRSVVKLVGNTHNLGPGISKSFHWASPLHTHIHTNTHTHLHTQPLLPFDTHTHTYTTHTQPLLPFSTHTHTHIQTNTHIHTHVRNNTQTH